MSEHEEIMESIGKSMGFVPEIMRMMGELDPSSAKMYKRCEENIQKDGALSGKVKTLMAMGIVASQLCESCVEAQMRSALHKGATKEEIIETLGVVFVTSGAPAVAACKRALKMLEMEAGKRPSQEGMCD